jgi:exodeoxyribonuclease V alpha subunit
MKPSRAAMLFPGGSARARLQSAASYPQDFVDLLRASDLDETGAYLAWQLADMAHGLASAERDAFLVLCARLLVAETQGSTRLALGEADRALLARVPEVALQGQGNTPLVACDGYLYTRRSHACETRVAAALASRMTRQAPFSSEAVAQTLREVVATILPAPSAEQQAAVAQALARHIGIIAGGPGTGKTTTALVLVRCWVRLGIPVDRIALCAPTGKAASRMEDGFRRRLGPTEGASECPKALTLHRLLGARSDGSLAFRAASEPLPFRAVIVDESSMVDLILMDRLLAALPDDVPLVLLGDADQLPSVSAGAVFRDLAGYGVRLERSFRTGSSEAGKQIAALARAVRAGDGSVLPQLCTFHRQVGRLRRDGAEHLPREARGELLRGYYQRHYTTLEAAALARHTFNLQGGAVAPDDAARLDALAASLTRSRILTVTRERATGSDEINALLHGLHGGGPGFLPGEPVLMVRNDYQRELWNGDQGIAIQVRRPGRATQVAVAFPSRSGWQAVDPDRMRGAFDLGYALTVHKSQGSEWDEVLFVLPDTPSPLLTRELFYTAVSRARRSVVLCGPREMLDLALTTSETRDCGVASRLAALVRQT